MPYCQTFNFYFERIQSKLCLTPIMSTLPIEQLVDELLTADRATRNLSVQRKIKKALADIKRARTLLHQAEQTKNWATKLCQLL